MCRGEGECEEGKGSVKRGKGSVKKCCLCILIVRREVKIEEG